MALGNEPTGIAARPAVCRRHPHERFPAMTHSRIDRVQKLLQQEIAAIIDRELDNPNLPAFITIFGVKLSSDLSQAVVFITFLQDQTPEVIDETIRELNHSAGYIGRLLARRVTLKRHPHLKFVYNPSTKYALDMEHIFQQIHREEQEP
jgi:ribosome-binding factor A